MKTTDNREQTVTRTNAEDRYPLIITRIGTSHMRVQAETEQEALVVARKEIELHGLPEEDTREAVDVRSDREAAKPVEAKTDVIETPEGIHLICVTSRYETPVRAAGADLEDAIRHTSVNVGISHPSDEDIDLDSPYLQPVSFDNERFVSFELRPAFRFIDNSLQDWKEASIYFEGAVADELTRKHPDGCTFEVSGLHVDDLKSVLEAGTPVEGAVRSNWADRQPTNGLHAELALTRQEMAGIRPVLDPEDRALQEICRKDPHLDGEGREAAESAYQFRHPDLDGGALRVEVSEAMLDRLFIEGIPARQAAGIIDSKGITTDNGFKEAAAEMRRLRWLDNRATANDLTEQQREQLKRVSDIAVMMMGTKGPHIRCRIDGEQQSAIPISMKDYLAARTRMTEKEELAYKFFREALDQSLEQEQKQGVRR